MNLGQHILVFGIRVYRCVISPAKLFLLGSLSGCRFTPSCSAYALEAVTRHGTLRGSLLAFNRICRCHPWGGCGEDPVPPNSPVDVKNSGTPAHRRMRWWRPANPSAEITAESISPTTEPCRCSACH